jgi:DNA-binding PadR family transcriptional regulator
VEEAQADEREAPLAPRLAALVPRPSVPVEAGRSVSYFIGIRYNVPVKVLTSEAAVLLALGEGPSSGVGLMDRLKRLATGSASPGPGTLYPMLSRLEARGLVRGWVEVARVGVGRPRRFVELTPRGIAVLAQVRQALESTLDGPGQGALPAPEPRMSSNLRRAFRVSALARRLREERGKR